MFCIGFRVETTHYYFAGRRVKSETNGVSGWPQEDRLGSTMRHFPYGEMIAGPPGGFATYERESNGIDYAVNRYYSSTYGRFLTPDPYRASGAMTNPQSWNRYAYVEGDPVNKNDPLGLWSESVMMHPGIGWDWGGGWGSGRDVWGLFPWAMFTDPNPTIFLDPWGSWPILGARPSSLPPWTTGYASLADVLIKLAPTPGWIGVAAKAAWLASITWVALEELFKAKQELEEAERNCPKGEAFWHPERPPHDGWRWEGSVAPGQTGGRWVGPNGGKLRPDIKHPAPKGPHWEYESPGGKRWDCWKEGTASEEGADWWKP
jgi:RHS repeat-associated protein